jgi:hypothetical protein
MAFKILKIQLHFLKMMCKGLALFDSNNTIYKDNKTHMLLTAVPDLPPAGGKSQL